MISELIYESLFDLIKGIYLFNMSKIDNIYIIGCK